jgi:hypothetical protein
VDQHLAGEGRGPRAHVPGDRVLVVLDHRLGIWDDRARERVTQLPKREVVVDVTAGEVAVLVVPARRVLVERVLVVDVERRLAPPICPGQSSRLSRRSTSRPFARVSSSPAWLTSIILPVVAFRIAPSRCRDSPGAAAW